MIIAKVNSRNNLNLTNNLLTDFMDFLHLQGSTGGMVTSDIGASYEVPGDYVKADGFGDVEKDDLLDYLEALGMTNSNADFFDYTHAFQDEDGEITPMLYRIQPIRSSGHLGISFRRKGI